MHQQQLTSLLAVCLLFASPAAFAATAGQHHARHAAPRRHIDRSGRPQLGKASIYAHRFAGRKMADGHRMNPRGGNAASLTLPLGTVAKVTNLQTGKSTVVKIQDRGPYVDGRIVDLSPGAAEKIGLARKQGIAPVEVLPISVPLPDGTRKPGAGAPEALAQAEP